MSFSEFQKQALEAHNHYRQEHKVQPLALSKDLCNYAQEWANVSVFCKVSVLAKYGIIIKYYEL